MLGVLVLGAVLGWWLKPRPVPSPTSQVPAKNPPSQAMVPVTGQAVASITAEATAPAPVAGEPVKVVAFAASPEMQAEAERFIDDAALTYDAEAVRLIAPYLVNGDPAIRRMALDGMIRASDRAGAVALREAAPRLPDAREAAAYLEAAEFLELPPMKSRKKQAAGLAPAAAATP